MFDFSNREFSFSEFPKGIHLTLFDNNENETVITADYGVVYNITNLSIYKECCHCKAY